MHYCFSSVQLCCSACIIPFAYGKIKTIKSAVTIWSTAGQIAYEVPDWPKQKITITPLRMTLNTVYALLTKISMNIKVYCLGLRIMVRVWVRFRYVMAKTVTGLYLAVTWLDIGSVMTGQPVMTGRLWPVTTFDRSYNLFGRQPVKYLVPKNQVSNTELDVTRRGFRGCK